MKYKIIYTAMVISLIACQEKKVSEAPPNDSTEVVTITAAQAKAIGIKTGHIQQQPIASEITVNGKLDVPPQNLITVSAPWGGFVKQTEMLEGMHVKKGDVLATLENQEFIQLQQDYLDNRAKLQFLETEYNRQLSLKQENVNAQKAVEQAKSSYESAKAVAAGLAAKLKMININPENVSAANLRSTISLYAPITGYVTRVNVNIGQFVNATDEILKLVNTEHLHAELFVFEKNVRQLSEGQMVKIFFQNDPKPHDAKVYLIGKEVSSDRTIRVHCHFEDHDHQKMIPGMFVTGRITVRRENTEVLPSEAVVNFEGQRYVFVQRDSMKFELVKVTTAGEYEDYTAIDIEGGMASQNIVVKGAFELLNMLKNTEED